MVERREYMKNKISEMLVAVHTHTQAYLQKRKERRKLYYLMLSPLIISKVRRLYVRGGGLIE